MKNEIACVQPAAHRELRPRLVENRLLEAQAVDERRQIAPGSPPLRLELLHAQSHASLVTAVDLVQAIKTSD